MFTPAKRSTTPPPTSAPARDETKPSFSSSSSTSSVSLASKLFSSKTKLTMNKATGDTGAAETSIAEICSDLTRPKIFVVTSGPTTLTEEEKNEWSGAKRPLAFGCTLHTQTIVKELSGVADIYQINASNNEDQAALIAKTPGLKALSDTTFVLNRELGLETFYVKTKRVYQRTNILLTTDGHAEYVDVPPNELGVTPTTIAQCVNTLKSKITPPKPDDEIKKSPPTMGMNKSSNAS